MVCTFSRSYDIEHYFKIAQYDSTREYKFRFSSQKKKQTKNEHFCSSVLFEVKCVMHTVLSSLLLRHFAPPFNRKIN